MRTNKADNFNRNITMFLGFAICIINNKTVEWLDSMDLQDKNAKITLAKKRAPDYLAKWQERRKELKQKRINRMKEKELEKLKKDAQHLQNKQNAIDNLLRLNIQPCKTSVDITTLLESCMNEHGHVFLQE
jgi:exopolysaccharide biosynthesis protein